ncbi:hypothetical protein C9374_004282 [Naegleria lovaniensis]|uniref:Uncharacterized protein n=1 Tax=Naegleria lovaniensis TaxID=51637 RepID=A0AA88GM89_NAELO|nr:uncharacterized protein C9374_004282 [Naegleria lovaniensis]KAG2383611.1 hypothetical protein C9374_004282 [Naegleria lovaniensis]
MSNQYSPLILEKVKEGVLSVCFKAFDFLLLRRANPETAISEIILEFIERNVSLKKVRKLVKNCFIYHSKYSQRKIILFDWLYSYPLLENTAWKQLEKNLKMLFGSGVFAIEIEPGVQYMKDTIKYCCRPYMRVESCSLQAAIFNKSIAHFHQLESAHTIDYDIVAHFSRKVVEQVVDMGRNEKFEQNMHKHIKRSQQELNEREGKFLEKLMNTLFSELEFKKQPTKQEKIIKFIGEWQGAAKLEIMKQINLEKQKHLTDI